VLPLILAGVDPWSHPGVLALLPSGEKEAWLERADAIDDPALRAKALTAMAAAIGEPQRGQVLSRALEAALDIGDRSSAAFPVAELIPLLSGPERERALGRAAEIADFLGDERERAYDEQYDGCGGGSAYCGWPMSAHSSTWIARGARWSRPARSSTRHSIHSRCWSPSR
jgi:hypothetical protein